jgi:hypothetical protein
MHETPEHEHPGHVFLAGIIWEEGATRSPIIILFLWVTAEDTILINEIMNTLKKGFFLFRREPH